MPQDSTTEERLARIEALASRGLKPAAAQLCRLILEKDPQNFEALLWLARTAPNQEEADKALQRAAQIRPNDRELQDQMAVRYPAPPQPWGGMGMMANPYAPNNYPGGVPNYGPPPGYGQPNGMPNYGPQPGATPGYGSPQPAYSPAPNGQNYGQPGPQTGYPSAGSVPPASPYGAQPGYAMPSQPQNSYDYLRSLSQSPVAAPVPPPVPMTTPLPSTSVAKTGKGPSTTGIIIGLLFVVAGLVLGIIWTMQVLAFQNDLGQAANVQDAQITKLSSSQLVADVKGQGTRTYSINDKAFSSLAQLLSDSKNSNALLSNSVKLSVTPGGRLTQVDVQTPNKGVASTQLGDYGLLGVGALGDWAITALSVILVILGLVVLGRSLAKKAA